MTKTIEIGRNFPRKIKTPSHSGLRSGIGGGSHEQELAQGVCAPGGDDRSCSRRLLPVPVLRHGRRGSRPRRRRLRLRRRRRRRGTQVAQGMGGLVLLGRGAGHLPAHLPHNQQLVITSSTNPRLRLHQRRFFL